MAKQISWFFLKIICLKKFTTFKNYTINHTIITVNIVTTLTTNTSILNCLTVNTVTSVNSFKYVTNVTKVTYITAVSIFINTTNCVYSQRKSCIIRNGQPRLTFLVCQLLLN